MNSQSSFPVTIVAASIIIGAVLIWTNFFSESEEESLLSSGIQAEAEILTIANSGNRYDKEPRIVLKLKVIPVNEEPYETEVIMVISQINIPRLQPGKIVKVRYDKKDKMKVVIEGTESIPQQTEKASSD